MIKTIWSKEPAAILGAVGAIVALAVGFGLSLTPAQVGLILAATQAVLALVAALSPTLTVAVLTPPPDAPAA